MSLCDIGYVVFDGAGSDINSWFAASRLLATRWTTMSPNTSYNVFSIDGYVAPSYGDYRRFHINKVYGGCANAAGYLVVPENPGYCEWDRHETYPQFLYAESTTDTK